MTTRQTPHKYGTGSCSDRIQASLQSTSNVQINWLSSPQTKVEHLPTGPPLATAPGSVFV